MTSLEPLRGSAYWQVLAVGIVALVGRSRLRAINAKAFADDQISIPSSSLYLEYTQASLTVTTVFISYVAWQHVKYYGPLTFNKVFSNPVTVSIDKTRITRRPSQLSEEFSNKPLALSHLQTQFGLLFVNLAVADFLQAVAFCLNWHWVAIHKAPKEASFHPVCSTQGILINIGDVACGQWSFAIACHTLSFLVLKKKPSIWFIYATIAFIWIFNAVLVIIGPIYVHEKHESPFFAWTRVWCFISSEHQKFRLWLHYLWILICLFAIAIIYIVIHAYLIMHNRQTTSALGIKSKSATVKVARRMLLYPLTYACVILPITCVRLASMSGVDPSMPVQTFAGCCLALAGFVDCTLYITTRNIIFRDPYKKDSTGALRGYANGAGLSALSHESRNITVTRECVTSYDVNLDPLRETDLERQQTLPSNGSSSDKSRKPEQQSALVYDDYCESHTTGGASRCSQELPSECTAHPPHPPHPQSPLASMNIDQQLEHVRRHQQQDQRTSADFWTPPAADADTNQRDQRTSKRFRLFRR